jgi:hypothetical protein
MAVVLIARFVAVLRSVAGFIAGANRMPFANFMIADSAGAVAWALFYGLGAFRLGKGVEEFVRPFLGDLNSCFGQSDVGAVAKQQRISVPIPTQKPMAPPSIAPNMAERRMEREGQPNGLASPFWFSSLPVQLA